jgi:hypothetical protein
MNIEDILNDEKIKSGSWEKEGAKNHLDMNAFSNDTIWKITEKGGWCFVPVKDDVYECHFGYTIRTSPFYAFSHTRQCFEEMKEIGAKKLIGIVASKNIIAKRFLEKLGCVSVSRKDGPYKFDNKKTDLEVYVYGIHSARY